MNHYASRILTKLMPILYVHGKIKESFKYFSPGTFEVWMAWEKWVVHTALEDRLNYLIGSYLNDQIHKAIMNVYVEYKINEYHHAVITQTQTKDFCRTIHKDTFPGMYKKFIVKQTTDGLYVTVKFNYKESSPDRWVENTSNTFFPNLDFDYLYEELQNGKFVVSRGQPDDRLFVANLCGKLVLSAIDPA